MDIDIHLKSVLNAPHDSSLLYNATLKLASRVLDLSSRVLARIRSLDEVFLDDPVSQTQAYSSTTAEAARRQTAQAGSGTTLPGPWGFVTSSYFLGLLVMAFVLNRIHNTVVPRRNPLAFHLHAARRYRNPWTLRHLILSALFPIDLTSTVARSIFRVPSIYFLSKCLLLWSVLLMQTTGIFPSWKWSWLQTLGSWVSQKPTEDVCWFTFTSACTALAIGALTNGLDGLNLSNNSPFNLFSFAFQLYIYASPTTHTTATKGALSRPDKHVMITIALPILQLTMTHCLEVRHKWARQRLVPTTICACLSLIHFHSIAWVSPSSYPLTNFVPSVVESLLVFTVLFAVALNAFAQLLVEGAITRPLFGHPTLLPKWNEDFSVVLFRLGTASLEATSVAGFGNEVGSVATANAVGLGHGTAEAEQDGGEVEVDRSGVIALSPAFDRQGSRRTPRRGLANEIRRVKAHAKQSDFWLDAVVDVSWHRGLGRFLVGVWQTGRGLARFLWAFVRGRTRRHGHGPEDGAVGSEGEASPAVVDQEEPETDVYERFLRGESLSDDEDDFEPTQDGASDESPRDAPFSDADDEYYEDAEGEAVQLYADLSQEASTAASAPLVMAHMTSPSPLTRRRYERLVPGPPTSDSGNEPDNMAAFVRGRRKAKAGIRPVAHSPSPDQSRWNCVICTTEPREIICWPCRCLALCDDCRENLASRSSASKHICPCCRRSVEGYSKIYIP
ncbi:hypothetical protein B0H21DRAFT_724327 [Amylocystis lapponica]|nr:hypothetical protein B0H21DRAFT_724327 [Amylocystis lapponica]